MTTLFKIIYLLKSVKKKLNVKTGEKQLLKSLVALVFF